jgi:hypothetical protein
MGRARLADQAATIASELAELCRAHDYATLRLLLDIAALAVEGASGPIDPVVDIAQQIGGAPRDLPRSAPHRASAGL